MPTIADIYRRCIAGPFKAELTAQNVSLYHTSPFTIYCEKFVPEAEKDPLSPYRELLQERGIEHERRILEQEYPRCRPITFETTEEGFKLLLHEMAKGAEAIYGLPLLFLPENMQGKIDILEKRDDHPSVFGNFHYIVTEIKLAKHIKKEHVLQGAFYTYILSQIQGHLPHTFRIINHDNQVREYSFADCEEELRQAVQGTKSILDGTVVPTATYNASEWPWERYTNHEAIRNRDVSLIGHVGPKTKEKLVARGFKKIWHVASTGIDDLSEIPGISKSTARKIILGARSLVKNEPIPIDPSVLNIPTISTEIYLDMEGTDQPDLEDAVDPVDYLIGAVVRKGGTDTYHPFIAPRMQDEGKMFREFLSFLKTQKDYVIYHWHNYEYWHMRQLAKRHNLTDEVEEYVIPFMIDLHRMATRAFAFPTYTNGLKDVASFLGFRWRHEDVNALDAIAYYIRYQSHPEDYRDKLQDVIDYNEDDCRATKRIKEWLEEKRRLSSCRLKGKDEIDRDSPLCYTYSE
ncbi:MAG: TM0106 family RecB-like putative nuclease [Deltaproteobacteria bacterium]|nr:TM0106 family RecB-like putative nuclease [Deltaproteobacteria bacterium]